MNTPQKADPEHCQNLVWVGSVHSFPCGLPLDDNGQCARHGAQTSKPEDVH